MQYPKVKYIFIIFLTFLCSCTIDKRLYRSGYYFSFPKEVKNNTDKNLLLVHASSSSEVLSSEVCRDIADKNDSLPLSAVAQISDPAKLATSFKSLVKNSGFTIQSVTPTNSKGIPSSGIYAEEDKIEKDIRSLLIASASIFLASILYVLFSIAGIQFLVDIFIVLLSFSIIGLWIFALMLHSKYFYENEIPDKEKDDGTNRVITKKRAFLLAGFLGIFGAHRFYLGYTDLGLFEMFTLGGFFVLSFIDMLRIKSGKLKPVKGSYDNDNSTYTRERKKISPNRSQRLIRIGVLISLLALFIILGFAIFV